MARPRKSIIDQNGSVVSGSTGSSSISVSQKSANGTINSPTSPQKRKRGRPRKSTVPEEDDGFVFKRKIKIVDVSDTDRIKSTLSNGITNGHTTKRTRSPGNESMSKRPQSQSIPSKSASGLLTKDKRVAHIETEDDRGKVSESLKVTKSRKPTNKPSLISDNSNTTPPVNNSIRSSHSYDDSVMETSSTSQVPLHEEETPIIRRNQKLRNQSSTGKRRSSLSNRGKRLSNIGNGFIADPHSDVDPKDFSKHLDENLSDSQRLKQLLVWCLKRNLEVHGEELKKKRDQSTKSTSEELTALTIARHIFEEEVLKNLIDGKISIDWHSRPENSGQAAVRRVPNSLNITAQNNLEAFEKRLVGLQREKEALLRNIELVGKTSLSESKLEEIVQTKLLKELDPGMRSLFLERRSSSTTSLTPSIQLQSFRENLPNVEVGVAQLRDGIHKIGSITRSSAIFIDKTMAELSKAASSLSTNTKAPLVGSSSSSSINDNNKTNSSPVSPPDISPYDLLRVLSRLES